MHKLKTLQNASLLNPDALNEVTQSAVKALLSEGESQNTVSSYRSALRYWAAWFFARYGQNIELPVSANVVIQFVVDHADRSSDKGLVHELPDDIDMALVRAGHKGKPGALAHNTLVHRMAVLSKAHQMRQLDNPCQDPRVRELLSKTRKAYAKRGALPKKKDAITKAPLQALLATCDDSLMGLRDRALLLFAWSSGGRRRSEVAAADMAFLNCTGPNTFNYNLAFSKTNQSGADRPENYKPIRGVAGEALSAWLLASHIAEGAIFRQVRKGGKLGPALSPAAIRDIVKRRCALAGLEGNFGAHSLRSGFVTEAGIQNVSLPDTMTLTGHQSMNSVLGYFRSVHTNAASDLMAGAASNEKIYGP